MVDIKETSLLSLLQKAIQQAKLTETKQLVSITKQIGSHDPIALFEQAKKLNENRTFWKSATEEFYLISVGNICKIVGNDTSRYDQTKQEWEKRMSDAIIYNPFQTEGTGLLLFGGMSFDPKRERSSLWRKFPDSEFVIPKFTFTKNEADYYLTTTIKVSGQDQAENILNKIQSEESELLTPLSRLPSGAQLIAKREIEPEEWKESVQHAIDEIRANRAEKIVLARELRIKLNKQAEIAVIIDQLLKTQQNSYVFAYERGDNCFVGATPERLVKVKQNELLSTCLAGTAPRGETKMEDKRNRQALFHDSKNREEHEYVVQMIKQSISDYCKFLDIPKEPDVLPLKNLQHLYTPVIGELKENYTVFDVIRKLHPTPALGGVPTEDSLTFIREHEQLDRGWYGSPVGWLDSNDYGEFSVAIRSGLIQDDEVSLFAGCGVMSDSTVESEYEETNIKFLPMLTVLEENNEAY